MCQDARRNSPSVAVRRPASRCSAMPSRIPSSSIARSSSGARPCSRASSRLGGRSRLPTWSARNGGVVRGAMPKYVPVEMAVLTGPEVKTLGAAWHEFRVKRAPQLIGLAVVAAAAARIAIGGFSSGGAVAAVFLTVVYPFGEWPIHVHLLHLKPFRWRGRVVELPTAAAHRVHHEAPERLDLINFSPSEALAILLLAVPVAVAPLAIVFGAGPLVT